MPERFAKRRRPDRDTAPFVFAGLSAFFLASGAAGQAPDPPGRLVEIEGRAMHVHCRGTGSPTVILEAGISAWSIAWLHVQDALEPIARTCVYDRAGYGWSEAAPGPRTAGRAAGELRTLLENAGERPPFVAVGHSFGGYVVRIFADRHPDEVAGIVLVDAAHADQLERLPPVVSALLEASLEEIDDRAARARDGPPAPNPVTHHGFFDRDPFTRAAYAAALGRAGHHETHARELRAMVESAAGVRALGDLRGRPLGVLSAARGFDRYRGTPIPVDEANRIWLELQDELAALSDDVVHVVSRSGPHTIQYEEPGVVVGVIREVVERVRSDTLPNVSESDMIGNR